MASVGLRLPASIAILLWCAAAVPPKPESTGRPAKVKERPITGLPYTPVLDLRAMDKTVNPCTDFYAYSCAGWMKSNPIPPDQARWSVYNKLAHENQRFLWAILEAVSHPSPSRLARQQKIGDLFASCMDEEAIEKRGIAPLKPFLSAIDGMKATSALPEVLARLHLSIAATGNLMFGLSADQDFGNSSQVIAFALAGGLGLPDRDYYFKDDARSKQVRAQYLAHLQRMLHYLGDAPELAKSNAEAVMATETSLAKATLTRVERRDPYQLYHKMTRDQLQALTPSFDWTHYLSAIGAPNGTAINVTEPEFFKQWERELQRLSLAQIKTYLRWHVVNVEAPYLSSKLVKADFDFYRRTLHGVQEIPPRWKRCVAAVDQLLGEALGQEFVDRVFSPAMKQRTLEMTQRIEAAMEQDIAQLDWMRPTTKAEAQKKLHAIANKIGYPDQWRDYRSVEIAPSDFLGNVTRATAFEQHRQIAKIGKPVDRTEWSVTPPTVNAFYNPQLNDMTFPAGVLQPPLFDFKLDDAPNYGNTGSTVGHELTHGFDDQGRQFDAAGNLRDWWSHEDAAEFNRRASCISDQYAQYLVIDDIHINSKLTLGEDVADLGGTILAWAAWKKATEGQVLKPIDGFSPDQRFFIGLAQWACENMRPEDLRVMAITDPHSPNRYRINGLVANMPEFQKAFSCTTGQPMAPKKRCRVW